MKTEDDWDGVISTMFDEQFITRVNAQGKVLESMPEEAKALELKVCQESFLTATEIFLDRSGLAPTLLRNPGMWKAIHDLAGSEESLRASFTDGDESAASIKQYEAWRTNVIFRTRTKADA